MFKTARSRLEPSRYNTVVASPDGGHILFNQISGTMVVLQEDRLDQFRRACGGERIDPPFRDYLLRGGFLRTAGTDERNQVGDQWRKMVSAPEVKSLTIVPTDKCNLGCSYCYEEKVDWISMDMETQEAVKRFAEAYVEATPTNQLSVIWFGGEATLHLQCIENLTGFFVDLCERRSIQFDPFMVTNGTTLNEKVASRLLSCGIRRLQITVDGDEEDHDLKRPFLMDIPVEKLTDSQRAQREHVITLPILGQASKPRPARSSYRVIMSNVRRLRAEGFEIKLRMNVDHSNKAGVRRLLGYLKAEALLEPHPSGGQILAYTAPIFEGCSGCTQSQMTLLDHSEFTAQLREEGLDNDSWKYGELRMTGNTCTANMDFQFVINQHGKITKCWHHATDGEHTIGDVRDLTLAIHGSQGADPLRFDPMEDAECRECPVLPICMGGCKANNKFPEQGYGGRHDLGCHEARHTLPEHVLALYHRKRAMT